MVVVVVVVVVVGGGLILFHTPSTAFRHLPPNSARFSYATEGALFISAQLSTDAVSALRKVWVVIRLWKKPSAQFPSLISRTASVDVKHHVYLLT